jgi:hypothetical protein
MFILSLLICLIMTSCDEKPQNEEKAADVVYPVNLETIILQYPDSCIKNIFKMSATFHLSVISYVINSQEELDSHLLDCEAKCPSIDFAQSTLVLVLTKTNFDVDYQLVQPEENKYRLDITYELPYGNTVPSLFLYYGRNWHATIIVAPKMDEKPELNLLFKKTDGGGYEEGYPKDIATVDFSIHRECYSVAYIFDIVPHVSLLCINSQEELDKIWYSECEEERPSIDFDKYTLLILFSYQLDYAAYQLLQTAEDKYRIDIAYGVNSLDKKSVPIAVLAPKMQEKPEVNIFELLIY